MGTRTWWRWAAVPLLALMGLAMTACQPPHPMWATMNIIDPARGTPAAGQQQWAYVTFETSSTAQLMYWIRSSDGCLSIPNVSRVDCVVAALKVTDISVYSGGCCVLDVGPTVAFTTFIKPALYDRAWQWVPQIMFLGSTYTDNLCTITMLFSNQAGSLVWNFKSLSTNDCGA